MRIKSSIILMTIMVIEFCLLSGKISEYDTDTHQLTRKPGQTFQHSNSNLTNNIVFDDFELVKGLEIIDLNRRRFIQLVDGAKKGRAEIYFFEPSAKYDITLFYIDESNADSEIRITINDRETGLILSGSSNSYREKTIPGINIQQWSRIALEFKGDDDDKCRIEKLVLTPVGAFDGNAEKLVRPVTLRIYDSSKERLEGRKMFSYYVRSRVDTLNLKRQQELAGLKNPGEWRERQKQIRDNLKNYFGEFPERTPLNAKIVGKLDREGYTIEKIIFESQPKYYVTANLYIPEGRKFPLPGVLFTCGHSDEGKGINLYHETCLGLVKKGYIVLAYDPIGQGERSEFFNNSTRSHSVHLGVEQHHYFGRTAFLTDWTLSGLRTWDGIRAVDYLESRSEVDKDNLAVVGNSGGGQMTLLITAVDERIKVCAAAHPGGSMENTYLRGQTLIDREILSLIPPRPARIIVGNDSGEEPNHRKKLEDMQLFYEGLGYRKDLGELVLVDGVHDMRKPKREAAYEWFNKWFDKETEGKEEAVLVPEKIETLWCTESGNTIVSLGGESGQTLNAKRAQQIYKPDKDQAKLKERIATRTGLTLPGNLPSPQINFFETFKQANLSIEKLTFESEKGIIIPSLLIKPDKVKPESPVYIFSSDKGKPNRIGNNILPFLLAKNGAVVLAIDVRGTGETSPVPPLGLNQFTGYTPLQWQNDVLAIQCAGFGRTTLGMRTFDVIRGIDFLNSRDDLKGRKIITIGEGMGGLWALLASIYDSRVSGVITVATLPSYMQIIKNKYYNLWDYFWVPGALRDFDIPDLAGLVVPKPQIWINPVDALCGKFNSDDASLIIGSHKNLLIISPVKTYKKKMINLIADYFK